MKPIDEKTSIPQTVHACGQPVSSPKEPAVRVFYDGGCPLCRREIAHYQRLPGADQLAWVDINQPEIRLKDFGLDRAAAMASLHVLDAAGRWHIGAWAFAEMWSRLPGYRWLTVILRKSGSLPLVDRAYALFARWRLRRRCEQPADGSATPLCVMPAGGLPSPSVSGQAAQTNQTQGE